MRLLRPQIIKFSICRSNFATVSSFQKSVSSKDDSEAFIFNKYSTKLGRKGISDATELKDAAKKLDRASKPIAISTPATTTAAGLSEGRKKVDSLPSYAKPLCEILDMDKVSKISQSQLREFWTFYHSKKSVLSAVVDEDAYKAMLKDGQKYPIFVLPLARDSGIEFYLLNFQGHQIYFTSLLSYQMHKDNAPPELIITHYTDLISSHNTVLLRGELTDAGVNKLTLSEAQHLMYLVQEFYGSSSTETKRKLVQKFHEFPDQFKYENLIDVVGNLK